MNVFSVFGLQLVTLALGLMALAPGAWGQSRETFCGDSGVWVQILGAGGPELNDGFASASYLVWIDGHARLMVDTGPGSSAAFDRSSADIGDLDAIVYTQLSADHAVDLPALIEGAYLADRTRVLHVFGPDGNGSYPATTEFARRLIGPEGAFAHLQDHLAPRDPGSYRAIVRDVTAVGRRRWAQFHNEHLNLSAMPVHHGPVPALAWRVDTGGYAVVFTGDFNNQKNTVPTLAKDADALIVHHAITEGARGAARDLHVTPGQIGRIASQASVRMLILGHRMARTRGSESRTREAIAASYDGPLIFANDLECWGL